MRYRIACLCLLLTICLSAIAQQTASVPRLIRFAGQVKDATGTVGITFTLHKTQEDSAVLWTESQNVKVDASGKYTVLLGTTKPEGIPAELFISGEAQWLGIRVEGKVEQPRVLLASVPYALKAAEAETLAGHAANEFVTSDKLSSAVQEQVQQAHFNTYEGKPNMVNGVVNAPATTFTGSNTSQVVSVIQNGTGTALVATAKSGTAITGISDASTGATIGLLGQSASKNGIGIRGFVSATTGNTVGLFGSAASTSGIAMAANASATSGSTIGLEATVFSPDGVAAIFQNSVGGPLIRAYDGTGSGRVIKFQVDGLGNVTVAGGLQVGDTTYVYGSPARDALSGTGGDAVGLYAGDGMDLRGGNNTGAGGTAGTGIGAVGGNVSYNGDTPGDGIDASGGGITDGTITSVVGGNGGKFTGGEGDFAGGPGIYAVGGNPFSSGIAGTGGVFTGGNGTGPNNGGYGVYASPGANQNIAGWFQGDVNVTGAISAGTKDFKIDHPLDPTNKYLVHASVESSEMMNIYSGNVRLNESGEAAVKMPSWFEALNGDFRYSLTSIGAPGPNLYIKQELASGQFGIAGGTAGQKVSWTVTAVRHDAYANAHPLQVEEDKKGVEQGRYLHPGAFGHPESDGVGAAVAPRMNPARPPRAGHDRPIASGGASR